MTDCAPQTPKDGRWQKDLVSDFSLKSKIPILFDLNIVRYNTRKRL